MTLQTQATRQSPPFHQGQSMATPVSSAAVPLRNVVFDFCDVLLDWQPRKTLEGQYPTDVIDTFFDPADEYGFEHYDKLSDGGWSRKCILDDYENHHGAALSRVFRTYFDRYRLSLAGMQPGMDSLVRNLIDAGIGVGG